MRKEIKENRNRVLQKEHFEILLEDIQSSVKAIAEGHSLLNNKIDRVSNELHETKNELIFLIKATVDHAEERINKRIDRVEKKIEDGDRAVMEHIDHRFDETNQKFDVFSNNMKIVVDKLEEHDERISRLEHKSGL